MKVSELKENIRGIIRKKLDEATIDVPNPANETPQTKKQKIDLARRTTGNKNLGTEKDPVEFIEEDSVYESGTGDQPISSMSREDLLRHFNLDLDTSEEEFSTEYLRDAMSRLDEEDFLDDDDNTIIEDVEDVDSSDGGDIAKMYDEIYEINANVAPGSRYQIEVSKDGNFIILTQDNGQEIIVHPDDVKDLIKVILKKYNETN